MTHYAHILTLDHLELMAHVGFYDEERGKRQRIALALRLYFPEAPACCEDDHAKFLDYGALANHLTAWGEAGEFRLIEYMGKQAYHEVRRYLDQRDCASVHVSLRLTKCTTPLPNLKNGASFLYSDLPAGSTVAYAQSL